MNLQYFDQQGHAAIGEVQFFTSITILNQEYHLAVVSQYGDRHAQLWEESYHTYWTAAYLGNENLRVIQIKEIQAVVMMAPDTRYGISIQDGTQHRRWYLMERPGLKLTELSEEVNDN